jgi:hypothetical protein
MNSNGAALDSLAFQSFQIDGLIYVHVDLDLGSEEELDEIARMDPEMREAAAASFVGELKKLENFNSRLNRLQKRSDELNGKVMEMKNNNKKKTAEERKKKKEKKEEKHESDVEIDNNSDSEIEVIHPTTHSHCHPKTGSAASTKHVKSTVSSVEKAVKQKEQKEQEKKQREEAKQKEEKEKEQKKQQKQQKPAAKPLQIKRSHTKMDEVWDRQLKLHVQNKTVEPQKPQSESPQLPIQTALQPRKHWVEVHAIDDDDDDGDSDDAYKKDGQQLRKSRRHRKQRQMEDFIMDSPQKVAKSTPVSSSNKENVPSNVC